MCAAVNNDKITIDKRGTGLLYSQIGYNTFDAKKAVIRSDCSSLISEGSVFEIQDMKGFVRYDGKIRNYGEKWGVYWWQIDFSGLEEEGRFTIALKNAAGKSYDHPALKCEPFDIGRNILWERTMKTVAIEQFEQRILVSRNRKGFKDCGSTMREAYSNASALIGMLDLLSDGYENFTPEENDRFLALILHGLEYISMCQDKAAKCGFPDGAVVHEMAGTYSMETADAMQCSLAWAQASLLLADIRPEISDDCLGRAVRAFDFVLKEGPKANADGFLPTVNGAPAGFTTPCEWSSFDLCFLSRTALTLAKVYPEYRKYAIEFCDELLLRQVDKEHAEGGLYGHFYTFNPNYPNNQDNPNNPNNPDNPNNPNNPDNPDAAGSVAARFTEKANTHCGHGHDMGTVFPHYISAMIELSRMDTDVVPNAAAYAEAVRSFAYNYFIPACHDNPFGIIPQGYYSDEAVASYFEGDDSELHKGGLLVFCGPWHGTTGTYGHAAALALRLGMYFEDPVFKETATDNIQWIAGLNAGVTEAAFRGRPFWYTQVPAGCVQPVSLIEGVGNHSAKGWSGIAGSIPNGFSTNTQFRYDVIPCEANDGPFCFTDEDWIPHSGAWMSALSLLHTYNRYYDDKACRV